MIFDDCITNNISQNDLIEKGFYRIPIEPSIFIYSIPIGAAKYDVITNKLELVLRDGGILFSLIFKGLNISEFTYPWKRINKNSIKYENYIQDQYLLDIIWKDFNTIINYLYKYKAPWTNYQ